MNLVFNAKFAITDSGGIQEETTYLRTPCLTLRPNTERPVTINQGTNRLCTPEELSFLTDKILACQFPKGTIPKHWDSKTAERIANSI